MRRILIALLLLGISPLRAEEISGRVVGVLDGDTIDVLTADRRTVRIRLADIDAPETSQPYGANSKRLLSALVFGKPVSAQVRTRDRYGRSVARVRQGATDVNGDMVRQGAAWRYVRYSRDQMFARYEDEARSAGRGLWRLQPDQRIAPWAWRAARLAGGAAVPPRTLAHRSAYPPITAPNIEGRSTAPLNAAGSCAARRSCRQMTCAQAREYLRQCGSEGIDGDGDGKPCERQCGH